MTDKTVYYVCKYTPVEVLEGCGIRTEKLDPEPLSFACAEECSHPNLCGYGKAVLEEVLDNNIRRLLLTDCCDVCVRIYDILKEKGNMEFLFLMELPHKNTAVQISRLASEIRRLKSAVLDGGMFDEEMALAAWKNAAEKGGRGRLQIPYVRLAGAHGGRGLQELLEKSLPLPVENETCTGKRMLQDAAASWSDEAYAEALLNQDRACMRMQFSQEKEHSKLAGTVFHTVKFCDYYSFQYREILKKETDTLLKIETDCTIQSRGQLQTRIDAFAETIGEKMMNQDIRRQGFRFVAGIDSGSSSTEAVILDRELNIAGFSILPTGAGAAVVAEKALKEALENAGVLQKDLDAVITTGYGRKNIDAAGVSVTEITCHAKGAHFLYPEARTVLDIGGQDSKVICLNEKGEITNFVMNDKCAAGTGRFLDMMAKTLGMTLPEMGERGLHWKKKIMISSMCTVFAESEVVSLIAENALPEDIIHGLNMAVAEKTASLILRAKGTGPYIMTGGVAQNRGVVAALEEKLCSKISIPSEAQICGALGAALIAAGI